MKTIECAFISNAEISLDSARKHKQYTFNTEDDLQPGDILSVPDYSSLLMVTNVHKRLWKYYGTNGVLGISLNSITNKAIVELTENQDADFGMKYKLIKETH
jgi:type II secretory pathway component HofQ